MRLPAALLGCLRASVGTTVLALAACNDASAAAPVAMNQRAALTRPTAVSQRIDAPVPAAARAPAPASGTVAFTTMASAVVPDRTTTFEPCDPQAAVAKPIAKARARTGSRAKAATPMFSGCGPCGRG